MLLFKHDFYLSYVNKSLNFTVLVSVNLKVCINLTDIATVVSDFAFKYYH